MSGKTVGWTRAMRVLACLAVIAGLMLADGAQTRAAADTGRHSTFLDTGTRAGSGPNGIAAIDPMPGADVYVDPDEVTAGIQQFEALLQETGQMAQLADKLRDENQEYTSQANADKEKADADQQAENAVKNDASNLQEQLQTLAQEIDEHNAQPHTFQLPTQQAEYDAYQAEADALNARKSALNSQVDDINSRLSEVADAEEALASAEEQLDSDINDYNDQVTDYNSRVQQLSAQVQQFFEQEAAAQQEALASPSSLSSPSSPAAAMDAGGDAPSPSQAVGPGTEQAVDNPGGDAPSQEPQIAAVTQYATQTGATLITTQPGTAVLTSSAVSTLPASQAAELGSPVVTYDGLIREKNGNYEAVEVRTPGETLTPQQQAFESAIRRGGRARTTVNNIPEWIDSFWYINSKNGISVRKSNRAKRPASQGSQTNSQEDKAECLVNPPGGHEQNGSGWILNTDDDVALKNQNDPLGGPGTRAGEGQACVTSDHTGGSPARGNITGYQDATVEVEKSGLKEDFEKAGLDPDEILARCHIIGAQLGGEGIPQNLFPCYQKGLNIGYPSMRDPYETLLAAITNRLPANAAVLYTVIPEYKNRDSTIPEGVTMTAELQEPDGASYPIFSGAELSNISYEGGPPLGN
jgi:predicted  nucleic acid-binding Zn-ribbon protein